MGCQPVQDAQVAAIEARVDEFTGGPAEQHE
jgi:hypothetical protein